MYSMELSLFVLEAGIKLLERERPDLMYLSLTDCVQHKYAPEESEAKRFYREIDAALRAARRARRHRGADRRPRHERQVERRRQAERDLAAGHPRREVRQGRHARDLPDHRRFRRPPRRARRLRARLLPGQGEAARGHRRPSPASTASSRCSTSETACRLYDLPPDREGDVAVISTRGRLHRRRRGRARPGGPRRATACARTAACRRRRCRSSLNAPLNDEYRLKAGGGDAEELPDLRFRAERRSRSNG